jgi:hypothetical protein
MFDARGVRLEKLRIFDFVFETETCVNSELTSITVQDALGTHQSSLFGLALPRLSAHAEANDKGAWLVCTLNIGQRIQHIEFWWCNKFWYVWTRHNDCHHRDIDTQIYLDPARPRDLDPC